MDTITFDHVSKTFAGGRLPAVVDCSLRISAGSLVVLLGPSGCGKTTLLKLVNRLVEPSAGTILLNGTDILTIPQTQLRRQIGYAIQQVGLFPHFTVARNIAVVPQLLGWPREKIDQRIDELLSLIQLPSQEYRGLYPAQLSGGQQQRIGVARALAGDPQVLLMDEPFGAIDAITRRELQDELLRLQRKLKKTILFVTHDVEEALYLADEIVVMRAGRIIQHDTPFNILTHPADSFVHKLIGADDTLRQLGVVRVASAMKPLPSGFIQNGSPTIAVEADLRSALGLLLKSGAELLTVLQDDNPVGVLSLSHIRQSISQKPA